MNSLCEIKKRSATLHGGGYFTPGCSRTEAANDVQFLLEKLEEMTGWRNECGFRYNAEKDKTARCEQAMKQARWAIALQLRRWRDGDSVDAVEQLQNAHDALADIVGESKPEQRVNLP